MSCERQSEGISAVAVATRPVAEQPVVTIKCDMADIAGRGRRDVEEIVTSPNKPVITIDTRIPLIRIFSD